MPKYKRKTRYVRRTRRRKRTNRKGQNALVTQKQLKTAIMRKMESKRNTDSNYRLTSESELDFLRKNIVDLITPGVTDQGRIGSTIYLTGVNIKYVYRTSIERGQESPEIRPGPITMHLWIVEPKNGFYNPDEQWYKAFASGAETAYAPLDDTTINDGRRTFNNDMIKVHGHYTKTLQVDFSQPVKQATGQFNVRWKKPLKCDFMQNTTEGNELGTYSKNIFFYAYFYSGDIKTLREVTLNYDAYMAITTYYKD